MKFTSTLLATLFLGIVSAHTEPRLDLPRLCLDGGDGGGRYDYCIRLKDAAKRAEERCGDDKYCHNRIVGLERYGLFVLKSPDESIVQKGAAMQLWAEASYYLTSEDRERIKNDFGMVLLSGSQVQIYQRAREVAEKVIRALEFVKPLER